MSPWPTSPWRSSPNTSRPSSGAPTVTALLFPGAKGAALRPNNWRKRHYGPAVAAAGLAPLSPHDLRHTAASFLIAEVANPWMLAEILGHRDTRVIDLVYGHLFEKDREALRQRMSRRARDGSNGTNGDARRLPRTPLAGG